MTQTMLVGTDFGPGTMTTSGYARQVKLWKRGTPIASAELVLEIPTTDMGLFAFAYDAGGRKYFRVSHQKNFYESTQYLFEKGKLVKIDVPIDADTYLLRNHLLVFVRTPWDAGGRKWNTGALIATPVDDFLAGKKEFRLVTEPGPRESINGVSVTRDFVLVSVLNNVKGELRRYQFDKGEWTFEKVKAPEMGTVAAGATSPYSNGYFFTYTSFIQPTTLYFVDEKSAPKEVKRLPVMWDSSGMKVDQFEATSKDGTKIPFFIVSREGLRNDGTNPTLLHAYGGFEVSNTPAYATTLGAAWLERGGVYVLANIRGGGEFGPQWHRAGLKEHRQRIYDDFIAVAEELITTEDHVAASPRDHGRQQRRTARRRRADAAPGALQRGRRSGAPARHAALQQTPRRRELDGRIRRSRQAGGVGVHLEVLAVPERPAGHEVSEGAVHDDDARRPGPSRTCAQDGRENGIDGLSVLLLREHRRRPRLGRDQRAAGADDCRHLRLSLAAAGEVNRQRPWRAKRASPVDTR